VEFGSAISKTIVTQPGGKPVRGFDTGSVANDLGMAGTSYPRRVFGKPKLRRYHVNKSPKRVAPLFIRGFLSCYLPQLYFLEKIGCGATPARNQRARRTCDPAWVTWIPLKAKGREACRNRNASLSECEHKWSLNQVCNRLVASMLRLDQRRASRLRCRPTL